MSASSVNNSDSVFIPLSAQVGLPNNPAAFVPINNNPEDDPLAQVQKEVERLKKQLEAKDGVILRQSNTLDRISKAQSETLEKIKEDQKQNINLEEELAILKKQQIELERELQGYRQALIQPVPNTQNRADLPLWRRMWEGFKDGATTVGRFCRRHVRLIDAGIGTAGAILIIFFPLAAPVILLSTMATIAFVEWATSQFD